MFHLLLRLCILNCLYHLLCLTFGHIFLHNYSWCLPRFCFFLKYFLLPILPLWSQYYWCNFLLLAPAIVVVQFHFRLLDFRVVLLLLVLLGHDEDPQYLFQGSIWREVGCYPELVFFLPFWVASLCQLRIDLYVALSECNCVVFFLSIEKWKITSFLIAHFQDDCWYAHFFRVVMGSYVHHCIGSKLYSFLPKINFFFPSTSISSPMMSNITFFIGGI